MLRGARVLAIDDQKADLDGIVAALHRTGVGVLPILYKGTSSLRKCAAGIRFVFADINIVPRAAQAYQQHQAVASVMHTVLDEANGPWILVAWTAAPHQIPDLRIVLKDALGRDRAPIAVLGLDKSGFTTARGFRIGAIAKAIKKQIESDFVGAAILDLEARASQAAHDVTRSIVSLALTSEAPDVAQILVELSKATDPRPPPAPEKLFQTVGPVFQDRLIRRRVSRRERKIWQQAFAASVRTSLEDTQRAKLNNMIHFDPVVVPGDRGAFSIIPLELLPRLATAAQISLKDSIFEHFLRREKTIKTMKARRKSAWAAAGLQNQTMPSDDALVDEFLTHVRWGLVEMVPACDTANDKRGLRRAAVTLIVPQSQGAQDVAGDHVQRLPIFESEVGVIQAFMTSKITLSPVPRRLSKLRPLVRVRDQLLDGLTQRIAGSQSRLGWVDF